MIRTTPCQDDQWDISNEEVIRIQFEFRAKKHPYPVEADAERELLSLADERAENT